MWQRPCGYSLDATAIGGTLTLTNQALIFMPNRIASRSDWRPQRIPLRDITKIAVRERTGTPYNGGFKRRVEIDTSSGEQHLLIMKRPDDVVSELRLIAVQGVPAPWEN